jgi:hypothetical protein
VADLECSFITAGVQAAAGVTVVLEDTIADTVHAARPGVGGLALEVGNTGQTKRDGHSFAYASNSCPHNYEIISFLRGFTAAHTETIHIQIHENPILVFHRCKDLLDCGFPGYVAV